MKKETETKVKVVLALTMLSAIIATVVLGIITSEPKPKDYSTEAYVVSQSFVKPHVNYPATFKASYTEKVIERKSENVYYIMAKFTASNAFGVKQEHKYVCLMRYKGGEILSEPNWECSELNIR